MYYIALQRGKQQLTRMIKYIYALECFLDLFLMELTSAKAVRRYALMLSKKYQMN